MQPLPLHLQVAADFPDASCDAQIVLRRFQGGVRGLDPAPAWDKIQSQVDSTVTDAGRSNCRVGGRHTAYMPFSAHACVTECVFRFLNDNQEGFADHMRTPLTPDSYEAFLVKLGAISPVAKSSEKLVVHFVGHCMPTLCVASATARSELESARTNDSGGRDNIKAERYQNYVGRRIKVTVKGDERWMEAGEELQVWPIA